LFWNTPSSSTSSNESLILFLVFLPKFLHHWIYLLTGCLGLWVGIAWITAFNKILFLAWKRNFVFQIFNRFHTLFLMLLNSLVLDLLTTADSPKYLSYLWVTGIPDSWRIGSLTSWLVFLLKKIDIFSLFNFFFSLKPSHSIATA
jgi:hypothetical protein